VAGTKTGVRRSKNRLSWIQSLRGGEVARRSEGLFQVRLATQTVAHLRRRLNRSANANVCASDDGASRRPLDGLLVRSTASSPPSTICRTLAGPTSATASPFSWPSDAHDRADDPRTARRNKCRGSRTSTRASSAVVSKAIPLRQVGGGRATDAPQRWTSIICPPPRNFFARRNNSPPVGVSLTSGASHGTGERAPRCAR
jgi:hypothetical protein